MDAVQLPRKVLIANRGEIAVRVARTCRAMGIATVAVFSDADTLSLHVETCDEAVRLGGMRPADSYLRTDLILDAAARTGADAVHPGYGFLSENADFARAVVDAGLTWIGPPPDVIAAMGDKLEAKRRMADAGVPLVPGCDLPVDLGDDEVAARADEVGFPVMVKAAAGGGGKGMRVVDDPAELADAVAAARREAASAFGDDRVFLERFVTRPRHLEVQVLADAHGRVVHLFERECSIQRRHQKVIEEAPSVAIDPEVRAALTGAAVAAAEAIGYVNAGTVEFVADESVLARRRAGEDVDPREAFAFLEVNTRLQVEHPVTEQTVRVRGSASDTPIDLVRLQILVAAGAALPFAQDDLVQVGHAIEARLYAENPATFLPSPGTLHLFEPANGDGIRWDNGVRTGDRVSPDYDPMLAKAIGTAATRTEAAARLARALESTLTSGGTNRDLLAAVLRDEAFLAGDTTTAYLDERLPTPASRAFRADDATMRTAMVAAALHATLTTRAGAVPTGIPQGFTNALGLAVPLRLGDPRADDGVRAVQVKRSSRGRGWWWVVVGADLPPGHVAAADGASDDGVEVLVHGHGPTHVDLEEIDGVRRRVEVRTWPTETDEDRSRHERVLHVDGGDRWVTLTAHPRFPQRHADEEPGTTTAPMPGTVTTVAVAVGDRVERRDLLVTIEAMKMEHRVTADLSGEVTDVRV
ncbi:MAG: biotin carboxylase N-terminal domain-containing protein, partial [Egicoccus sp.]